MLTDKLWLVFHLIMMKLINMTKGSFKWVMIILEDALEENIEEWILKKKPSVAHAFSFLLGAPTPPHGGSLLLTWHVAWQPPVTQGGVRSKTRT